MNPLQTRRNPALLVLLLATSFARAEADPPRAVLAANDVVEQALSYSLALRSSALDIRSAEALKAQAAAAARPTIQLEGSALQFRGLEEQALGPAIVIPEIPGRYQASISLAQPLYTGGEVGNRKRGAALRADAARHADAAARAAARFHALAAYGTWSKAHHAIRSLEDAVKRMAAHADDVRNLREAGLATENDRLATDVLLDQTRLRLDEARRREEIARARIAFLTGRDVPPNAAPEDPAGRRSPTPEPETALLDAAFSNRAERAAALLQIAEAETAVRVARAARKPHAYLRAQYETANPNPLFFPPEEEWNDDLFGGVVATWDVFDSGLTAGRIAEAAAEVERARVRLQQHDDAILLEVREAAADVRNANDRMTVAQRARESAERNLQAATDLWQHGLGRHAEVLDAHAKLAETEYEWIAAQADARVAGAALDRAIGAPAARADPETHDEP